MKKWAWVVAGLILFPHTVTGEITWGNKVRVPEVIDYIDLAIDFDGTDDRVNLGSPASLDITGACTYAAWVYIDTDAEQNYRIFAKMDSETANGMQLALEGQATNYFAFMGQMNDGFKWAGDDDPDVNVSTETWYHVCGVFDPGASLKLYVNGNLVETLAVSSTTIVDNGTDNLWIGGREYVASETWDGKICEAAVWSTDLTSGEVAELYTNVKGKPLEIQPDYLEGYWAMDDVPNGESANGDTINDQSTNNNDGTGSGGVGATVSISI